MPTRNVVLTDYQAELIEQLVETGRFQNASEVLREGIRLVEQRIAEDKARIEALRTAILVGDADIEAGRSKVYTAEALRKRWKGRARSSIAKASRSRSAK
jgi:antitoxin ParD1/3/4